MRELGLPQPTFPRFTGACLDHFGITHHTFPDESNVANMKLLEGNAPLTHAMLPLHQWEYFLHYAVFKVQTIRRIALYEKRPRRFRRGLSNL